MAKNNQTPPAEGVIPTPEQLAAADKTKADQEVADKEKAEKAAAKKVVDDKVVADKATVKSKSPLEKLIEGYAKLYPANKTFHVTTDNQVFLKNNLSAAQNHQRSLGEGKVKSITVE